MSADRVEEILAAIRKMTELSRYGQLHYNDIEPEIVNLIAVVRAEQHGDPTTNWRDLYEQANRHLGQCMKQLENAEQPAAVALREAEVRLEALLGSFVPEHILRLKIDEARAEVERLRR